MAEATDLLLHFEDAGDFDEDNPQHQETLDLLSFALFDEDNSQHQETLDLLSFALAAEGFDTLVPVTSPSDYASNSDSDSMYPDDMSSLAFDLFNRCPSLDLALGTPSRPTFQIQNDECDDGSDWAPDEFFGSEAMEFSGALPIEDGDEGSNPFGWDLGGVNDGMREMNEEFEWEEVLEGGVEEVYTGHWDEPEVFSMSGIAEEYALNTSDAVDALSDDVELIHEVELIMSEGFVYTSDHDILVGLSEQESSIRGALPAARSVVESLRSVVLTAEDVAKNNTNCAVCKDEFPIDKSVKMLPCSHCYHEECILPWLEIRNTCPICRFELLTDDPEYEMGGNGLLPEEGQGRYDYEMIM